MFCNNCGSKLIYKKWINISSIYCNKSIKIKLKWFYCKKCKKKYLDNINWNKYSKYNFRLIEQILKNKYKDKNDWIEAKNICKELNLTEEMITIFMFCKKEKNILFVLKKSYLQYKKEYNGFFNID